jgi:hypothetical protein
MQLSAVLSLSMKQATMMKYIIVACLWLNYIAVAAVTVAFGRHNDEIYHSSINMTVFCGCNDENIEKHR